MNEQRAMVRKPMALFTGRINRTPVFSVLTNTGKAVASMEIAGATATAQVVVADYPNADAALSAAISKLVQGVMI